MLSCLQSLVVPLSPAMFLLNKWSSTWRIIELVDQSITLWKRTGATARHRHCFPIRTIQTGDFNLVWWDGLSAAMTRYPKMHWVWLKKHVSDFCGNNVRLYYWSKGTHSPKCEFCGTEDEYTMHICRCRDPGRDSMFKIFVKELHLWWLTEMLCEHSVEATVKAYLLGREATGVIIVHGQKKG